MSVRQAAKGPIVSLVSLAAVLALAYLPIFLGFTLYFRDVGSDILPARWIMRAAVEAGEPPLWNPYQGLGFPVLGQPLAQIFYPPNWLHLVGSLPHVTTWVIWLHLLWGAAGALLVARRFGCTHGAAAITGIAWGLSGAITSATGLALFPTLSWLPWCTLGFIGLLGAGGVRRFAGAVALAALPVAAMVLAGEPFMAIVGCVEGMLVAAIWRWRSAEPRASSPRWWTAAALLLALMLGGAVSAVSLVPAYRHAAGTSRAAAYSRDQAEKWSFHPVRAAELAAPAAMGQYFGDYPGGRLISDDNAFQRPYLPAVYLGASVLALALAAFRRGRDRAWPLLGVAALAVALALGRHTPLHAALRLAVPPLAHMRTPEKYLLFAVLPVALLAGLGATRLLAERDGRWRRSAGLVAALLLLAGAAPWFPDGLAPFVRGAAIRGVLAAAGVALIQRFLVTRRSAVTMLPLVVALDLAVPDWAIQVYGPAEMHVAVPPAAAAVLDDAHRTGALGPPRVHRAHGVEESIRRFVRIGDPLTLEVRTAAVLPPNMQATRGLAAVPGADAALPASLRALFERAAASPVRLLRLLGVGHAVLPAPDPATPATVDGLEPVREAARGAWLYRVKAPLPRVYVPEEVTVAADDQALQRLMDEDVVAGRRVLLASGSPRAPALASRGRCVLTAFAATHLEAGCDMTGDGLAVFVEQFAAGWSATVDGVAAPVLRANLLFRAVPVPRGAHRVVLRYSAPDLRAAATISMLALAALVALVIGGRVIEARLNRTRSAQPPASPAS
jgi:hypothetical protein